MTNLEKYNNIFCETFGVDASALNDNFSNTTADNWDSVHQLNIVAGFEDEFDVMLDPEDIVACTSYAKGKEILRRYDVEI